MVFEKKTEGNLTQHVNAAAVKTASAVLVALVPPPLASRSPLGVITAHQGRATRGGHVPHQYQAGHCAFLSCPWQQNKASAGGDASLGAQALRWGDPDVVLLDQLCRR